MFSCRRSLWGVLPLRLGLPPLRCVFKFLLLGALPMLQMPSLETSVTVTIFSVAEATGVIALIYLVRIAGPVFASQKSFTVAVGGVIWSILLLGVGFTYLTSLSLVSLMAGLALVANIPPSAELFEGPRKRGPVAASGKIGIAE